ncbi:GNAT family N-acetyltransferase [Streptomyces sp. ME02-8801-2C]|uniref:GNAT family N-acetyltransferase n=1 Tax=Streptomyces sp. ME02-8801-2C TaxID=3028680 RepID=UPI0029B69C3D|nr:GNAT family N-acetyltransferase [Streptomyces sp. ME02-8801-2C]MDX3456116.1 GNAT family N-acetyltransferase [Streptomyces sp. ME02-8801-2C]
MRSDDWHITAGTAAIDDFLDRAGDFLCSRPALHTTALTTFEKLRTDRVGTDIAEAHVLGRLEDRAGQVSGVFYRLTPKSLLSLTPLTPEQVDTLAARLAALGHRLPGVSAEHGTATAFAEAWQRHTGATPTLRTRINLYRLGTLTPPEPVPAGRGRPVGEGEAEREHLMQWCRQLAKDLGEEVTVNAGTWATTRFGEKRYTYWETPDGTPVAMAGVNPMVAGHVRVDPVYTPAHLRGRGYAGAVTVEVSRAALDAGATDVVLYADPDNPTSNALYQRIGYRLIAGWAVYDFG